MRRYRALKVDKKVGKQMSSLQRALWEKANTGGDRGVDMLSMIGVGRPYRNKYGEKVFATIDKIKKDVAILVEHEALEKR